jgi:hypothetical protein
MLPEQESTEQRIYLHRYSRFRRPFDQTATIRVAVHCTVIAIDDTEVKEGKTRMFRGGELSSQTPRMIGLGEFADFLSWNQDAIGDSPRCNRPSAIM